VEEDRDLDELDDGRGKFAHPVDQEAEHQSSLCGDVDRHFKGNFLVLASPVEVRQIQLDF
jgi:hypothetical protein